jgi:hypothetical protein
LVSGQHDHRNEWLLYGKIDGPPLRPHPIFLADQKYYRSTLVIEKEWAASATTVSFILIIMSIARRREKIQILLTNHMEDRHIILFLRRLHQRGDAACHTACTAGLVYPGRDDKWPRTSSFFDDESAIIIPMFLGGDQ